MKVITKFLSNLRGDVWKLLPMKEYELKGGDNHISDYLDKLIINMKGALLTFPELEDEKQYLYVLNKMQYIKENRVSFTQWRSVVLSSGKQIGNLCKTYGGTI